MKPLLFVVAIAALGATAVQAEESEPSDAEPQPSVKSPSFFDPPEFVLRLSDYFRVGRADASDATDPDGEADQDVRLAASQTADRSGKCDADCQGNCKNCQGGVYAPPFCKRPGEITFKPGLRLQPRYVFDEINNDHDFFIRRFRLKGSGKAYDVATYGAELKVDSSERFDVGNPTPIVENAWIDFALLTNVTYLKVGLYDIPFSRNALTSDSKLLLMDRTLIFDALARLGMADNTVGVMLHGRPLDGKLEYSVGVFDDIKFDRTDRNSHDLMPAGRVAWYVLDPAIGGSTSDLSDGYADYRESYLGHGRRLVLAANFAALPNVDQAASEFDLHAWGVDILFNQGPYVVQAEYDWFMENGSDGTPDLVGDGWYVQAGYILNCCWELAARYQTLTDPINPVNSSERVAWTSIGVNYYIHEHNLKIQTDYTWKNESETEIDNDTFQVQLQLDF